MTKLFLELDQAESADMDPAIFTGLSGVVMEAASTPAAWCEGLRVPVVALTCADPESPPGWSDERGPIRVVDGGLEQCARLRDARPTLRLLPRLGVHKAAVVYRMSDYPGEGFKFYTPDTSAIRGYRVTDRDLPLRRALEQAKALGFEALWLHAWHAAEAGKGLDLELLERARRDFGDEVWLSGGASETGHLRNLAREGGAAAVVVVQALLQQATVKDLMSALAPSPSPPPPEVPVNFEPRGQERSGPG